MEELGHGGTAISGPIVARRSEDAGFVVLSERACVHGQVGDEVASARWLAAIVVVVEGMRGHDGEGFMATFAAFCRNSVGKERVRRSLAVAESHRSCRRQISFSASF
jgi:hypothetical protein